MRGRGRLVVAAVVVLVSLMGYFASRQQNPITGETQHVQLTPEQEVALGLEAAPELAAQHGGRSRDQHGAQRVRRIGERIVQRTAASKAPYRWGIHLLDDDTTINAMALPGGQVFMTEALYRRLRTDADIAGVLGHEIGHVVARHGAEHLAKAQLLQGLGGAAVIAAYDPDNPGRSQQTQAVAMAVGQLVSMRYGRDDELESDKLGVKLMSEAGYDPRAMLRVMEVLAAAGKGRARPPEFFTTHPSPDRRMERIRRAIEEQYPRGVPDNLEK